MERADVVGAAVWLAAGAFVVHAGRSLGLGTLRDPGPGFLLFWVGLCILALAAVVLVNAWRAPAAAGPGFRLGGGHARLLLVLGALVAYAWLLERLGFLLTTALVLVFLFKAVEPQRWWVAIVGGVLSTLVAWVVFRLWLGAQLPAGLPGIG
jgi:putative tricarboxylic transport membrane protein